MEQEHAKEWAGLMDQALAQVRQGEQSLSGYQRRFQIAVLPSFGVAASWELFAPAFAGRGREPTVALVAWDAPADEAKFESPLVRLRHPPRIEPTIRRTRVSVSPDHCDALVAGFTGLVVRVAPGSQPLGADGTSYRFAAGDFFAQSVFEWWEDGPAVWAPLVAEVGRVLPELRSVIPEDTDEK